MRVRSRGTTVSSIGGGARLLVAFTVALLAFPAALLVAPYLGDGAFMAVLVGGVLVLAVSFVAILVGRRRPPPSPTIAPALPSADLRLVASRLVNVEKRVAALASGAAEASDPTLADVSGDLGLLSGLVKGLADTLGQQERELGELRARVDRLSRQVSATPARPAADAEMLRRLSEPRRDVVAAPGSAPALGGRPPRLFPTAPAFDVESPTPTDADPPAGEMRRQAIADAIEADRVELYLQPIVSLPQRHARGYEMLARVRLADGTLLQPAEFLPALERGSGTGRLDAAVLAQALVVAAELAAASGDLRIACNLAPRSLADERFLGALEQLVGAAPEGAKRLVLEIPQRAWRALPAGVPALFGRLRAGGVSFGMDRVGELAFDDLPAAPIAPAVVKLPCDLVLRGAPPERVAAVLDRLRRQNIRLVAERVEHERDIPDLIDLDFPLAQGFAFGAPRPLRVDQAPSSASGTPAGTAPLRLRDVVRRLG